MQRNNIIFIRDLRLKMNIGILPGEQGRKRAVLVNADITLDPLAHWKRDEINETVPYEELAARIREISAQRHFNLLEVFLETVAADILRNEKVTAIKISAEKPRIIEGTERVGVEIFRVK